MTQTFVLSPFQNQSFQPEYRSALSLTVDIQRSLKFLELRYRLQGNTSNLIVPNQAKHPSRQNNLWESTCFEFFFSPHDALHYYEVNLSPSGNWNIYRFDNYRTGMTEALEIQDLKYQTAISPSEITLDCHFPLSPLNLASTPLKLSITAVLAQQLGISYWAIKHSANQADFHQGDSFIVQL